MQCIYQKTKEVFTNPGATLFTESDTRVTLNSSRSKIYPGLDTLRNMEHICHFVKHVYPNMQKISKMTAANGRRSLTKNIDMLIININHDNSGRDMGCLKSIYKMSKSITPGGA